MHPRIPASSTAAGTRRFPRLLAISDHATLTRTRPGLAAADWAAELSAAGVDGLQVREKRLGDRALRRLASEIRSRFAGLLLLNGRCDVALVSGADGVHLPADGIPLAALRRRFGDRLLYGCSTHSREEVRRAQAAGADYAVFGPVFSTPGKEPAGGLSALREAAGLGLPILALGGIGAGRLEEVADAGAAGVAGIRLFHDPVETARAVAWRRGRWGDDSR